MEIRSYVEDVSKRKVNEYITSFSYGLICPPPPYELHVIKSSIGSV